MDNQLEIEAPDQIRADRIFSLKRKWILTIQKDEICKHFLMKCKKILYINWIF